MKILYVKWVDALSSVGWEEIDPVVKQFGAVECESIGYLLHEDDEQIILAATVSEKESNSRIAIPKGWIKSRRVIKCPKK